MGKFILLVIKFMIVSNLLFVSYPNSALKENPSGAYLLTEKMSHIIEDRCLAALEKHPVTSNSIEDNCAAVLAEHENREVSRKHKRGRPKKTRPLQSNDICRTIPSLLAVGRRTRMSTRVAEYISTCKENVDELARKKKELQRQMEEHDREIESEQIRAAHAAKAVSLRAMDSFMTKRSEAARRQHVKGKPRRKKIRKTLLMF